MPKKKFKLKLYFIIWASTLTILLSIFILYWVLMLNWYKDSEISALKKELESTTTQIADYYGDDINDFIEYVDHIAILSNNDLRSVIIKNNNVVDYKSKFTYIRNIDTREISSLGYGEYYLVYMDEVYYCFAKTHLVDGEDQIYIINSCPFAVIDANLDIAIGNLWVTIIISFFLSIIVTYVFSKYLSKPILSVVEDAKKLGDFNYKYSPKESIIEEIDILQDSFLKASNRLEETEKMEKEFLSGVSHELKAPITIIQSYAEMIKEISGEDRNLREEHLDVIIEQSQVLTKHINDINIISKVKSNAYDDKEEINAFKCLSKMVNDLSAIIEEKNIKMHIEVEKELILYANPLCIKYSFSNYINNAVKFAKENVWIKLYKVGNKIHFLVSNDGDGILEDEISKIWDRFYKGEKNAGSGLGLTIVKTICEHCGYEYSCESSNQITTFKIVIGE